MLTDSVESRCFYLFTYFLSCTCCIRRSRNVLITTMYLECTSASKQEKNDSEFLDSILSSRITNMRLGSLFDVTVVIVSVMYFAVIAQQAPFLRSFEINN